MSNPFPPENEGPTRDRFTVRLETNESAQLKLVAWFWNEVDRAMGKKRRSKWKAASVVERFVVAQLDAFWDKVGGGAGTMAEREEHLRELVAQVEKDEAAKRPPKKSKK